MRTHGPESEGGEDDYATVLLEGIADADPTQADETVLVAVPPEERHHRDHRTAVLAGALVVGLAVGGLGGYKVSEEHVLHADPAPTPVAGVKSLTPSTIDGMAVELAEACSERRDVLPDGKHVIKDGIVRITDNADRVVIVSENLGLHVMTGVKVREAFFCAKGPDVVNDGAVDLLAIKSYKARVTQNGIANNLFVNNKVPEDGSTGGNTVEVAGGVGNLVYQGDGLSLFSPVKVTGPAGHVVHAYQDSGSNFMFLDAYDIQGGGTIDQYSDY